MGPGQDEQVGKHFNEELFFEARKKAIAAVNRTAEKVRPGMSASDIEALLNSELTELGNQKLWHGSKIRIGSDTTKQFRDLNDQNLILQEDDLFFLDIGPVFAEHEGDYGNTFVTGETYKELATIPQLIFQKAQDLWIKENITGHELYQYAISTAKQYGVELNAKMDGHRLADFPHQLYSKKALMEFDSPPKEDIWVLEINILDSDSKRGAFFEDILTKKRF